MCYLQQPMRQKCAQMRLSVVQFESHQIHPFADLIGCRPSRCQRSTDQVAEGIKILPLPAVRFHFDPLHAAPDISISRIAPSGTLLVTAMAGVRRVWISYSVQICFPCSSRSMRILLMGLRCRTLPRRKSRPDLAITVGRKLCR